MQTEAPSDAPLMQRLYDRIWLLAAVAMLFFVVSYVGWGMLDVLWIAGW